MQLSTNQYHHLEQNGGLYPTDNNDPDAAAGTLRILFLGTALTLILYVVFLFLLFGPL